MKEGLAQVIYFSVLSGPGRARRARGSALPHRARPGKSAFVLKLLRHLVTPSPIYQFTPLPIYPVTVRCAASASSCQVYAVVKVPGQAPTTCSAYSRAYNSDSKPDYNTSLQNRLNSQSMHRARRAVAAGIPSIATIVRISARVASALRLAGADNGTRSGRRNGIR